MAAATLAAPGTPHGPCAEPCKHTDCAATRRMAEKVCRFCGKSIGYDTRFYTDMEDDLRLVHAVCLEDTIEQADTPRRA